MRRPRLARVEGESCHGEIFLVVVAVFGRALASVSVGRLRRGSGRHWHRIKDAGPSTLGHREATVPPPNLDDTTKQKSRSAFVELCTSWSPSKGQTRSAPISRSPIEPSTSSNRIPLVRRHVRYRLGCDRETPSRARSRWRSSSSFYAPLSSGSREIIELKTTYTSRANPFRHQRKKKKEGDNHVANVVLQSQRPQALA